MRGGRAGGRRGAARRRLRAFVIGVAFAVAFAGAPPGALPGAPGAARAQGVSDVLHRLGIDAERAAIPLADLRSGGPPPQGIPALGFDGDLLGVTAATPAPSFEEPREAAAWLGPEEPVVAVRIGDDARAYPLRILTWHEIVNDTVGNVPVAVTFCPLCNSAVAFDRRVPLDAAQAAALASRLPDAAPTPPDAAFLAALAEQADVPAPAATLTVSFGVSGLLADSNLLMFDSLTGTLWSQLVGEGAVGALAGTELLRRPALVVSFAAFRREHPDGRVLSRDTGFPRDYGRNPYVGYDRADTPPFLYDGPLDGRLPPKERVVVVDGSPPLAFPFTTLRDRRVLDATWDDRPVVAVWFPGTRSTLDTAAVADGADVGSARVFSRRVDGRALAFRWTGEALVDDATGSSWNEEGEAVAGPLRGVRLEPVPHLNTFWFAWAAFRPQTRVVGEPP